MKTKVYAGFDVTKLVLAVFVVCIHTHPFLGTTNKFLLFCTQYGFHLAVPFFYAMAGFLLFNKTKELPLLESISSIWKYLFQIIKLYIIWSIVYLPAAIYGYHQLGYSVQFSVTQYIKDFIFLGEHHLSWPLWYLLGTIYGLLFIMLMIKLQLPKWSMLLCGYALYWLSLYIDANVLNADQFNGVTGLLLKTVLHTIRNGRLLTSVLFITIGMLIARSKWLIHVDMQYRILFFVYILAWFMIRPEGYGQWFVKPAVVFYGMWCLSAIQVESKPIFAKLRETSTIFYFTHMLFVFLWSLYTGEMYPEGLSCFAFTLSGCLITTFFVLFFSNKKFPSVKCKPVYNYVKKRCH